MKIKTKKQKQPAILPLTTDYLPSVESILKGYDAGVPYDMTSENQYPFDSRTSLLIEMVCQRLSQEYQLIDKIDDIAKYRKLITGGNFFVNFFFLLVNKCEN
jgi:hypothetical protein